MKIIAFSDWRVQNIERLITFIKGLRSKPDVIVYSGDDISSVSLLRFTNILAMNNYNCNNSNDLQYLSSYMKCIH